MKGSASIAAATASQRSDPPGRLDLRLPAMPPTTIHCRDLWSGDPPGLKLSVRAQRTSVRGRNQPAYRLINARQVTFFVSLASLLLVAVACGGFDVSITHWATGSADVSGSITNSTGSGCTDREVTLKFEDHNGAVVTDWTFGAGELAAGQTKTWTTHMFDLLHPDLVLPSSVTSVSASAECADQH